MLRNRPRGVDIGAELGEEAPVEFHGLGPDALFPACLASYLAASARETNASDVVPPGADMATPTPIPIIAWASRSAYVLETASTTRCAIATASSDSRMFSRRITNSSSPKPATVSYGRTRCFKRADFGAHRVAGLVSLYVLHELESVEVAVQHRDMLRGARTSQQAMSEPVDEHLGGRVR